LKNVKKKEKDKKRNVGPHGGQILRQIWTHRLNQVLILKQFLLQENRKMPPKLKNLIKMVKTVVTMVTTTMTGHHDLRLHTKNRKSTNIINNDPGPDRDLLHSMITGVVETEIGVKNRKKVESVQGQEAEVLRRLKKESTDIITITTIRINQDIAHALVTARLTGVEVVWPLLASMMNRQGRGRGQNMTLDVTAIGTETEVSIVKTETLTEDKAVFYQD